MEAKAPASIVMNLAIPNALRTLSFSMAAKEFSGNTIFSISGNPLRKVVLVTLPKQPRVKDTDVADGTAVLKERVLSAWSRFALTIARCDSARRAHTGTGCHSMCSSIGA